MRVRNILGWAGAGTAMGYVVGSLLGEYLGISISCQTYGYTQQDLTAYRNCRADQVNALGVDPSNPGLINAYFNSINLSCAAAGFVGGLGYGLYREIKNHRAVRIYPDDSEIESSFNIYISREESGAYSLTDNPLSSHSPSSGQESIAENNSHSPVSLTSSNLGIFKTPRKSYEIDNADLIKRAVLNENQQSKTRYTRDDLDLIKTTRRCSH